MAIARTPDDYWAQRLAQAMEDATRAQTMRSRSAYLDLAAHYLSMHLMINGRQKPIGSHIALAGVGTARG